MRKLLFLVGPFRGVDVRRMAAFVTLSVALPRLPFWPGPNVVYPLKLLPQEVFGWVALGVFVALIVTAGRLRLHWVGRLVGVLAFALWVTLAVATSSYTSLLVDATIAYACLGEITAQHEH